MSNKPKKIIVIRHADKPIRESDQGLSSLGRARAEDWARYIPQNLGTPETIFATAPSAHSIRPLQTILPLYESLEKVNLIATLPDEAAKNGFGKYLASHFDGQIVLVCWHHGCIPALMEHIGAKKHEYPDPWPEDDFSTALVVTFEGGEPTVTKFKM